MTSRKDKHAQSAPDVVVADEDASAEEIIEFRARFGIGADGSRIGRKAVGEMPPVPSVDPATCVPTADTDRSVARLWDEALLDAIRYWDF